MSEKDKEPKKEAMKKPKLRGWVGRKAGAEEVAGSVDEKITKSLKEDKWDKKNLSFFFFYQNLFLMPAVPALIEKFVAEIDAKEDASGNQHGGERVFACKSQRNNWSDLDKNAQ